ncbi:MAG: penicillin-binding protein 2 [Ruminococcus sp.]|nr:penicillin-binding protein 2 [Ruminococcus sp.]
MRKTADNRVLVLAVVFIMLFLVICFHYFDLAVSRKHVETAYERAELTIVAGEPQGTIFDRNMKHLVNTEYTYKAVVVPYSADKESLKKYVYDTKYLEREYKKGSPFVIECKSGMPESAGITVFRTAVRNDKKRVAEHILGYTSEGVGVAGIEAAYDRILRENDIPNSVTYNTDGFGRVLIGDGKIVHISDADKSGVVTTLDKDIQKICEKSGNSIDKGAIVVSDISNGDILAMASFPRYDTSNITSALSDERSPMINRALYSYGVGSIFKLVTACEAIEEGRKNYSYKCRGQINVKGQSFNCHKADGHGIEYLTSAIRDSCNTYFISLSRMLDAKKFRALAYDFGFGKENHLCRGIIGASGVLPTDDELSVPAELANFSFGQGKLTATPLQINQFTCCIANSGEMPQLRLIKGLTTDGEIVIDEKAPQFTKVISKETAEGIRHMMTAAIRDNENSNAQSAFVDIAAKTSTAQTGRFSPEGDEYCHAWITGFFPAYAPKYAVTVLVEDGGYGNETAAPIFRDIAEKITLLEKKRSE